MTTIAYDGRYIACDSQETMGNAKTLCTKFVVVNQDFVAFTAGTSTAGLKAVDHIKSALIFAETGKVINFPDALFSDEENFTVWLANLHNGVISEFTKDGMSSTGLINVDALGTGRDFALTAMYLGKSAREAVQVASQLDCYTGGKIHVFDTKTGTFIEGGEHLNAPSWNAVPSEV